MTSSTRDPNRVTANTGVPPEAPNATRSSDHDLADGPPATDEEVGVEATGEP